MHYQVRGDMESIEETLQFWKDEADRRGRICIQFAELNDALAAENALLRETLKPFADCGAFFQHPVNRRANEDRSLRSFSNTALLSDYVSNPIDRLKVRDFKRAVRVYLSPKSDGS